MIEAVTAMIFLVSRRGIPQNAALFCDLGAHSAQREYSLWR